MKDVLPCFTADTPEGVLKSQAAALQAREVLLDASVPCSNTSTLYHKD